MSKTINIIFFVVILTITILSCNNRELSKEKQEKLLNYLSEIDATDTGSHNYLIVPQNICHSCLITTYKFFNKYNTPLNVILIGQAKPDSLQLTSQYTGFSFYIDREELYYNKKNLLIASPQITFLTLDNNTICNYHEINAIDLELTLKKILLQQK